MDKKVHLTALLLGIVLILWGWVHYENQRQGPLRAEAPAAIGPAEIGLSVDVTFLDIGQGDASYIAFPNGQDMLIDCARDGRVLAALGRVMKPFDRTLDYLVVTHPDADHYGGCIDVLKRFDVKHIVYNGLTKPRESYWKYFWDMVEAESAVNTIITKPETFVLAGATFEYLYPDHNIAESSRVPGATKDTGDNNTSAVMKLQFGGKSVLFTGDMEEPLEAYLLAHVKEKLDSDVLKVGHHGSASSSGEPFLTAVTPEIATISVGKENTYGHPSPRVFHRLERAGSQVFRTDEAGDILVRVFQDRVVVLK